MRQIEYQFEYMTILFRERLALKKVRTFRLVPASRVYHFRILYDAGFLAYDLGSEKDGFNRPVRLGTVHITDRCVRYFAWCRSRILGSVILPILISAATTILIHVLERWLLPMLK